jgi:excisionase family DNA binding protein
MNDFILSPITLDELETRIVNRFKSELNSATPLQPKQEEELLTSKQSAKVLGVSLVTLHKWKTEGRIPFCRMGTRVRFKRSELFGAWILYLRERGRTMASKPTPPQFKTVTYQLNDETNYYQKVSCDIGFNKLPDELKIEETRRPEQIHSSQIIRGRIKNGRYLFFTGLLTTEFPDFFFGDHYEFVNGNKKNSFVLFHFSKDKKYLNAYFYNHFKVYPKRRKTFIREQVEQIKKGGESRPPLVVPNHFTGQLFNDL